MSEIGLNINVDSYNNEGIKTIKGNNNAEIYKLYILKNKRRLSLVGKTVKLGYVMVGTTNGDVIENLNITNAEQGEITFPITNRISKKDGVYSCQLAIYGADGFLEHTATFGLTVEANIFTKIAGEIVDSKDFTYLENILDKASKLSEKLKENTSSATNANSNLESNITEANNINSKLLENTSTATSLNKNLESNIDLAKEVKETIKDLDTKNIEATEKIETLTGLNSKATELSNNINQALPLNSELVKNTESAKVTNTNLAATNQEATTKNTELQASLEKTKEFIEGLDGSQNIPQLRLDVTKLQDGLKSNQALAYSGSSISANNTLEGRTEGMRIGGSTLVNLLIPKKANLQGGWSLQDDNVFSVESDGNGFADIRFNDLPIKRNTNYTCYIEILENTLVGEGGISVFGFSEFGNGTSIPYNSKGVIKVKSLSTDKNGFYFGFYKNSITSGCLKLRLMLIEGNNNNTINYFEGLKSFGETEQGGDKYKISILSTGKNLFNTIWEKGGLNWNNGENTTETGRIRTGFIKINANKKYISNNDTTHVFFYDKNKNFISFQLTSRNTVQTLENSSYIRLLSLRNDEPYNNFQFEEGSQVTSFEPYQFDKKDILIKEPLRSKVDTCDLLYEDNGQVKIDRYVGIRKYQEGDENNKEVITDKINTVYVLDKPVTEIVENCVDIDLDTYQEKTYFNILNSLPGTLDFKVPSNIASIVQNTAKEVNNIWDVINNLLVPSLIDINKNVAMSTIKNNLK
ncbi:BppU family phage baseplate upper protein [Clostridium perfringens]|uniref:BppU family phage baseplate upper protein n=1 Tax=Clostridium perfringens TaxID=1502 RepID=UPI0018E43B8F|nr:BppU family phage baseplate upper protein [Clostridium perfringens]MBI6006306.1 BppU family phage baseplate upper protein [Clostridium perfringens]MDK0529023.1 BppU family phage baseplate upper protein [Clostridium perfringens]MDK0555176.1 BppU family phage baseplate upper protein [Clostridium perfringens]MDK0747173.1 BppU family phage baseplate upper protein [Clostridium perfringens]MDK0892459.1 BppU family phage baseplate upper protein [Clostridium perfringens]